MCRDFPALSMSKYLIKMTLTADSDIIKPVPIVFVKYITMFNYFFNGENLVFKGRFKQRIDLHHQHLKPFWKCTKFRTHCNRFDLVWFG